MKRRGITLIELLVALAIIGVLLALALPTLSWARRSAERAGCLANLRGTGQAMQLYRNDFDDVLPFALTPVRLHRDMVNPLDILAPYLDAPIPRIVDGEIIATRPFACPADRSVEEGWRAHGWSYLYFTFDLWNYWYFYDVNAGRRVMEHYTTNPTEPILADRPLHHLREPFDDPTGTKKPARSGWNELLLDGSARSGAQGTWGR